MSGAAAGCQADRARSVALGVVTGGGQSIPAALAAYLNVAFRSMLTPCRVGSAVPSSARGIDGQPPTIVGHGAWSVRREAWGVERGREVVVGGCSGRQSDGSVSLLHCSTALSSRESP